MGTELVPKTHKSQLMSAAGTHFTDDAWTALHWQSKRLELSAPLPEALQSQEMRVIEAALAASAEQLPGQTERLPGLELRAQPWIRKSSS